MLAVELASTFTKYCRNLVADRSDLLHRKPGGLGAFQLVELANPALTIGRMFSDTFAGIAPGSAPGFIAAQLIGAAIGFLLVRWLYPKQQARRP